MGEKMDGDGRLVNVSEPEGIYYLLLDKGFSNHF